MIIYHYFTETVKRELDIFNKSILLKSPNTYFQVKLLKKILGKIELFIKISVLPNGHE